MGIAIEVFELTKRYAGRAVVDRLSFSVEEGEVFALLGRNGAGKTTTVEILEGYRTADSGRARVLGLDPVRDRGKLRPYTGQMLQSGGLYPQVTPREALRLFASFYPNADDPAGLLDRLELTPVGNVRFRQLSGGQRQRLNLGLALIGRPRLVFLDEPTASMDPQARHATWAIIRDLQERGTTVMLTTHFMDEAEQLANRVAIVDHGRLLALDAPARLRQGVGNAIRFATQPAVAEAEVASLLGVSPADVEREIDGTLVVRIEASPELVGRLATWLAERGVLLTELRAGSRTLEQAFLDLTESSQP